MSSSVNFALSKNALMKSVKTGDATKLFNALQNPYYSLFVDVRESNLYHKNRINNTLNIPFGNMHSKSKYNNLSKDHFAKLIKDYQIKHNKHLIVSIYFFTNNVENDEFWSCLSIIREAIIDFEICRASKLCVITDTFDIFAKRFPFLLTNDEKEKEEKLQKQLSKAKIKDLCFDNQDHGYPNIILDDALYLGDLYHATTKKVFVDLNITHVVNCTRPNCIPCTFENDADLKVDYIRVPVDDIYDQDIKQHFDSSNRFIDDALNEDVDHKNDDTKQEKKSKNAVLIHCRAGISRSSSITISYLIKYKNMRYEEALKYVRSKRPIIDPNATFVKQLKEYEKSIISNTDTVTT